MLIIGILCCCAFFLQQNIFPSGELYIIKYFINA